MQSTTSKFKEDFAMQTTSPRFEQMKFKFENNDELRLNA